MVVTCWIVGFLPSDTNDEDVWMTEENGFIVKELKCIYRSQMHSLNHLNFL